MVMVILCMNLIIATRLTHSARELEISLRISQVNILCHATYSYLYNCHWYKSMNRHRQSPGQASWFASDHLTSQTNERFMLKSKQLRITIRSTSSLPNLSTWSYSECFTLKSVGILVVCPGQVNLHYKLCALPCVIPYSVMRGYHFYLL